MKRFFVCFCLCVLSMVSCENIFDLGKDKPTEWVLKYEIVRADGKTTDDYVQCLVNTPWLKNRADCVEFFIKDYWTQEYYPFYSGDIVRTIVDSPNLHTYLVRIWLKRSDEESFQLYSENWNRSETIIPEGF